MTRPECAKNECSVPAGSMCALRHNDFHECPEYREGIAASQQKHTSSEQNQDIQVPWTGYSMTRLDTSLVWGVRRAPVIAMIGLPKSGKSSFLGTLYLRLKSEQLGGYQFAGSLTLRGWDSISAKMYWKEDLKPGFPPRTSGEGREPGFLHLAIERHGKVHDVLVADVPGEWFAQLLENLNADAADPARWIIANADAALFFIDSAALIKPESRYLTERNTKLLLDRVSKLRPDLPLVTVQAKHDTASEEIDTALKNIEQHLEKRFGQSQRFETIAASAEIPEDAQELHPGQQISEALAAALEMAHPARCTRPPITREQVSQALAALQGVRR